MIGTGWQLGNVGVLRQISFLGFGLLVGPAGDSRSVPHHVVACTRPFISCIVLQFNAVAGKTGSRVIMHTGVRSRDAVLRRSFRCCDHDSHLPNIQRATSSIHSFQELP